MEKAEKSNLFTIAVTKDMRRILNQIMFSEGGTEQVVMEKALEEYLLRREGKVYEYQPLSASIFVDVQNLKRIIDSVDFNKPARVIVDFDPDKRMSRVSYYQP